MSELEKVKKKKMGGKRKKVDVSLVGDFPLGWWSIIFNDEGSKVIAGFKGYIKGG